MANEDLTTEVFGKQIRFNYLVEHLRFEKSCISRTGKAYIEETLDYFDDIKEEFERIVHRRVPCKKCYPLREIFEAINGKEEKSLELILQTVGKLEDAQEYLEQLSESPVDFYQTKGKNELLDICQKFSKVYDQLA